jgi:hypothetical protein
VTSRSRERWTLVREPDRAGRGARAAREVLEQLAIGGAHRLAVRTGPQHQRADLLAGMDERQPQRDARDRSAVGGGRGAGELERDVAQAQRVRDRLGHHGEDLLGPDRLAEPAPELGYRGIGFVALAVQQAIDAALQPVAQRMEGDRHQHGGRHRRAEVDVVVEQPSDEHNGRDVEGAEHEGRAGQDHRAVDVDIEAVEAVAQDRDAHQHG